MNISIKKSLFVFLLRRYVPSTSHTLFTCSIPCVHQKVAGQMSFVHITLLCTFIYRYLTRTTSIVPVDDPFQGAAIFKLPISTNDGQIGLCA